MKLCAVQFSIFQASLTVWLLSSSAGTAQIIPDNTLANPSVVPSGCRTCTITGGTRSGSNLFHSFEQFSVPVGGSADFNQAIEVENIFARVTGRSRSTINGTIQANGTANLFLLNPNGIIFGPQAALNVGGSFLATTGDRLIFADGTEFSAVNPQATPLLSISTPIGLQMGRSGAIINRSRFRDSNGAVVGLRVPADQTLALVGNGVLLTDGALSAAGGRIAIGSVAAPSTVFFDRNGTSYDLSFAGDQTFRDIRLIRSSIDTSGTISNQFSGGAIDLNGRDISMSASVISSGTYAGRGGNLRITADRALTVDSSSLGTFALANGRAGDVVIQADRSLRLSGVPPSLLGSQALEGATGRAGDVRIETERLSIQQGSRIEASTFGRGNGGNIEVQAAIVAIVGSNPEAVQDSTGQIYPSGQITSGLVSQVAEGAGLDAGDSGRLTIETDRLVIRDGGLVSTATFAGGDGGRLSINAAESIVLSGASPAVTRDQYRSGIFASAEPAATGRVGALSITTDRLIVQDRAEISANNRGLGQPGSATLTAEELDVQGGGEIRASSLGAGAGGTLRVNADSIELIGTGTIESVTVPSGLAALARRSGRAGNLQITATDLNIRDGAEVSVSGTGSGAAGNLFISADQIALDRGTIAAVTEAGSGAEITLENSNVLLLSDHSRVTAQANNNAAGGNVTISAPDGFMVGAGENNDVVANAIEGRGGNITITVQSILGLEERRSTPINNTNDIDASSEFGLPGSVTIVQPDVDPSRGLVELSTDIVDASSLIAQTCSAGALSRINQSELIVTGRGGLPPSPDAFRTTEVMLTNWATLPEAVSDRPVQPQPARTPLPDLVEAQGFILNAQGQIVLVANPAPVVSVTSTGNCVRRPQ